MRLAIPPPVAPVARARFPILGVLAPVAVSVILAVVLGSPFLLAFAILGPVIAIGSLIDGRRQARTERRTATAARDSALRRLEAAIEERHDELRRALRSAHPGARASLGRPRPAAVDAPLVLGFGEVPSGIDLDPADEADVALARRASVMQDAPVLAAAALGIGVVGTPALAAALARSLVAQTVWLGAPHHASRIARAVSVELLDVHCAVIVRIYTAGRAEVIRHPHPPALTFLRPELVSLPELARELGPASSAREEPPNTVDLEPMLAAGATGRRSGTAFLVDGSGPIPLDIVLDGPHAVIGGTTGSGKSELLVAWLLAVAACCPPDRVGMLLFDFKGGSALDPLLALPHVAGLVTDLDDRLVDRAARSLRAELRRREGALRAAGARSIEQLPALARLLIVVDEFAALLDGRGELHDVFVDIAARGRSLGMHLILCTQRPAGVIRDSLLANCGLRISLRVVSQEDSVAVVGVPDAAKISRSSPGRCMVVAHGEAARPAQVAVVAPERLDAVVAELAARWPGPRQAAGWLPPLTSTPLDELLTQIPAGPGQVVIGRSDPPDELTQPLALWDTHRDRSLIVVGARGSGRSTALATLARQVTGAILVSGRAAAAIEALSNGLDRIAEGDACLVVDDLDLAITRLPADQLGVVLDRLVQVIQEGRGRVVLSFSSPVAAPLRPLIGRAGQLLALRCSDREEHMMLGGGPRDFDDRLFPGSGRWAGFAVQVADSPPPNALPPAPPPLHHVEGRQLLITSRPAARAAELERSGVRVERFQAGPAVGLAAVPASSQLRGHDEEPAAADQEEPLVVVIESTTWLSAPMLWLALQEMPVLIDACSAAEFRQLTRRAAPPPPLADLPDRAWLLLPEAEPTRVRLPQASAASIVFTGSP